MGYVLKRKTWCLAALPPMNDARPANVSALTRKRHREAAKRPTEGDCRVQRDVSWPEGKAPSDSSLSGGLSGSRRARASDLFHGSRGARSGSELDVKSREKPRSSSDRGAVQRGSAGPRTEEIGLGGAVQVRSGTAGKRREKPRVLKRPAARLSPEAQQLDH